MQAWLNNLLIREMSADWAALIEVLRLSWPQDAFGGQGLLPVALRRGARVVGHGGSSRGTYEAQRPTAQRSGGASSSTAPRQRVLRGV